jgi:hypothetical protein
MLRRAVAAAFITIIVLAAALAVPQIRRAATHAWADRGGSSGARRATGTTDAVPQQFPQPVPSGPRLAAPANPASIQASGTSLFEWAFLDRATGQVTGSKGYAAKTNTIESMIKPGIVGDWLRRQAEAGKQPTDTNLKEITAAIIDSVDTLAQKYYNLGGGVQVVNRLEQRCGLTDIGYDPQGRWSWMEFTARDSMRYAQCIADGRVAGPQWTEWLLDTMRHVRGSLSADHSHDGEGGRWGIIDGLPPELAKDTSIKNGWTPYISTGWHVNCMAIHPDFILVVEVHAAELSTAALACRRTAAAFVVRPAG